jgi:hypothetical protein
MYVLYTNIVTTVLSVVFYLFEKCMFSSIPFSPMTRCVDDGKQLLIYSSGYLERQRYKRLIMAKAAFQSDNKFIASRTTEDS